MAPAGGLLRARFVLAVALVTTVAAAPSAIECVTVVGDTPETSLRQFAAVFDGTVVARDTSVMVPGFDGFPMPGLRLTFQVHRIWRGPESLRIAVIDRPGMNAARAFPAVGDRLLVKAAAAPEGRLVTSACGGLQRIEHAQADLELLARLSQSGVDKELTGIILRP